MENTKFIDKAIEILQAFKEGKTIEAQTCDLGGGNIKYDKVFDLNFLLESLAENVNIRIAKEPAYRPYATDEEFLKASKEHGWWIEDDEEMYCVTNIHKQWKSVMVTYQLGNCGDCGCKYYNYQELLEKCRWVDDKSPCGILEQ